MLPEIVSFDRQITLVGDSGIQFMDFGLNLKRQPAGEFVKLANGVLTRLIYNEQRDYYFYQPTPDNIEKAKSQYDVPTEQSLKLLDSAWLPLPLFRFSLPNIYQEGPLNWARFRIVKLPEPDIDGHSHRMTLAIDTRIMAKQQSAADLSPNHEDVNAGATFAVATATYALNWYLTQDWVKDWLIEVFKEASKGRDIDEREDEIAQQYPLAHYLNLLSLMAIPLEGLQTQTEPSVELPQFKVIANREVNAIKPIPVDLILDVGNSRTCGILIEDHGQSGSGLMHNYVLKLRDLSAPEHIYTDPFESKVEFSQAFFGKDHCSVRSGRHDAFQWPTIARIGREASRLASRRRGSEGSTGLSSPKRYLWDEKFYGQGWRFNGSYVQDTNPLATAAPFANLIDEKGEALHTIEDEMDRIPVFTPRYSRSSLMTFMLSEVLTQAISQINSPEQRIREGHAGLPRQLRHIILTVPPGLPMAERCILDERMRQAVGLVWKSLRWHTGENDPYADGNEEHNKGNLKIPLPKIRVEWDEASCAQLVYLYTEINQNFAGHPEVFFDTLGRPDRKERETITIASIDIGGGTTDLVITDYRLDRNGVSGGGANVHIIPHQRFRDSFKIAGDDILLDVIQSYVLPAFELSLREAGVHTVETLMSQLCGSQNISAAEAVLRQQLSLQLFVPLALHILTRYEQYDPQNDQTHLLINQRVSELLPVDSISDEVEGFVRREVQKAGGPNDFKLTDINLNLTLAKMHNDLCSGKFNIDKVLTALCEVLSCYHCDLLLLTGRPSQLPGIQAIVRRNLPLPPGRILSLHGYQTGTWYPFHKNGHIDDPKSTASVGAMLSQLCANHSIPNFHFRISALKPYSTIRHIGIIDMDNLIHDADVIYRHIESEDGQIKLPLVMEQEGEATTQNIVMRGDLRLGYRQLDAERWPAAPLYTLRFSESGREKFSKATSTDSGSPYLKVRLTIDKGDKGKAAKKLGLISDRLTIAHVSSNTDKSFSKNDLELELNTMPDTGLIDSRHWLDSGSVKK
ncbi:virulence factor SrfB [Yersinia enterocolitica]|uniref:Virulence factor n=1 Tax=Yersinia enterocolitica TaxID=630 RepID=A0A9P1PR63_YEREN|nr:virulence factor SrfB [Yersinia enterocolitica]EKN3340040.1 virulence factor SrfB [Yersinia enterocolitica]EKN3343241.1 virulence factor SrfB [Yersinia enterocolitica]EKN3384889.1 virulence factor SrfB [Yersinia enterocolitica]EKN3566509.1 virulence factor SrfB [Yersinia enterocolitica]EKN3575798.1 virulence factor SrfB [Yersinia enterocolitica]